MTHVPTCDPHCEDWPLCRHREGADMTHSDRDASEPKCHGVSPDRRSKWQNGDCPHEIALLNRATKPQEATGATPAPTDPWRGKLDRHTGLPPTVYTPPEDVVPCPHRHIAFNGFGRGQCGACGEYDVEEVPAGLPLHEATDRDGDNVPSVEEPWREYAEAIDAEHRLWIGPTPDHALARACVAVEDRHTAAVLAEVERVTGWMNSQVDQLNDWMARAEKAEATIARVEALAFEWDAEADANDPIYDRAARALQLNARELFAALRGPEPTEEP